MSKTTNKMSTETMVIGALMTALVIILQCLAVYTTFFGPFATAIGLVPIVIGAALCGTRVGAWLGFVFGATVLLTGNAALLLAYNVPGAIITVLLKGIACGAAAGFVNKLLKSFNPTVAAIVSALVCPLVNTAVFLLGCRLFFYDYAGAIAQRFNMSSDGMGVFYALAGANFAFEIGMNLVLSSAITRIVQYKLKKA